MEKISWTNRVKNEDLHRVNEERKEGGLIILVTFYAVTASKTPY